MTTKFPGYPTLLLVIPLGLLLPNLSHIEAAHPHPEQWYAQRAAESYNGLAEFRMPDGTLCDVLTPRHAIEVEFALKWSEAIGQSLHNAFQTGRLAGILLILTEPEEERYLDQLNKLIDHYELLIEVKPLRTWENAGLEDFE